MNKLIKSAMLMASAGAMLCIVGCGGGNSPEAVAIESQEKLAQALGAKGFTFKVVKSEINGDKGTVFVDRIDGNGEKEGTSEIPVRKVDGKWNAMKTKLN